VNLIYKCDTFILFDRDGQNGRTVGIFYILILFRCRYCYANRIIPVLSRIFVSQSSGARGRIPNFW